MTCDEFRKHNANGIDGILALTRAERSACGQHWANCWECRDWTMCLSFKMSPVQELEVEKTKYEDIQDPETFSLPPEETEKFDLDVKSPNPQQKGNRNAIE